MRMTEKSVSWVVYRMTIHGKPSAMNAVCEQGEWDAMEHAQPGHHQLIRAGITNEGEAEQLARTVSVDGSPIKPAELKLPSRQKGMGERLDRTTPPSTRIAAPLVVEAHELHTETTSPATSSDP